VRPLEIVTLVCGVDCSTLTRPNWIAWLDGNHFTLDCYIPTEKKPLPVLTFMPGTVASVAFDAPQGLPAKGARTRTADTKANTPTRALPASREELAAWRAYRGLIETGISIFWWAYENKAAAIAGLHASGTHATTIVEAYPRYVIKRLWPDIRIPSKRNAPLEYIDTVYSRIQKLGFVCRSMRRPTVDQVDAMLCAIAARDFAAATDMPAGSVGMPPVVDHAARVLREGYIVCR
jgi:predicted nuclease with RNAse H fold